MKGIILFILLLLLVIIAIVVGSQNTQVISVNYLIAKSDMRVSTFMVLCLAIGMAVGFVSILFKFLSARVHIKLLQKRVKNLSKEP